MTKFLSILIAFFLTYSVSAKTINLATSNWEPYYGEKLKNNGFFSEIVREAFKRQGYTLKITWVPWIRALKIAKMGKYDGLLGAYYNDERKRSFHYSKPIVKTQIIFIKMKSTKLAFGNKYKSLINLKGYKIGVVKGATYTTKFDSATYLKKIPVATINQNLKKLFVNRIDLIIGEKMVLYSLINNNFSKYKDSIVEIHPALKIKNLYITINRAKHLSNKIIIDFNKGLEEIKKDGTYKKILKKHDVIK